MDAERLAVIRSIGSRIPSGTTEMMLYEVCDALEAEQARNAALLDQLEARYEQVGEMGDGNVVDNADGTKSEGTFAVYRKVERPMEGTTR